MTNFRSIRMAAQGLALAAIMSLAACGGGGGNDSGSVIAGGGIIGGTGFKGPVANGTVTAYALAGGVASAVLGTGSTDVDGKFRIDIGSYAGPVMLQVAGGSYVDEATGANMPMATGDVMTVMLASVASGASVSGIQVTPLTSMAQAAAAKMPGGMTQANIAAANSAVGTYFMVNDIVHTNPMNTLQPGSGATAGQNEVNYGMAIAAMSQYAKGQGMAASSALVTAMMNDASDGVMNGKMGANPVSMSMGGMMGSTMMPSNAGTSGLGAAMQAFANSAQNRSGVTATMVASLIAQLNTTSGQLVFGTSP